MEAWDDIMEECGCVDIIYTDFSKTFDSVSHNRLLSEQVECYGIKERKPFEMDRVALIK